MQAALLNDHDNYQEQFDSNFPGQRGRKDDTLCKKILRFLFSFVGLLIVLAAYTVGGAYYFYKNERPLEELRNATMYTKYEDLQGAMQYITAHLSYIAFDEYGSLNNCSGLVDDPFYVEEQGYYALVCLDKTVEGVMNSSFCQCVWAFQDNFQQAVSQDLNQLIKFLITAVEEVDYKQDPDTHQPVWDWMWTFPNSILFTMTTLTLIGYGFIVPTTGTLKVQLMVYTIVGLPITMMFLANIGGLMAKTITRVYSRACCRWCRIRRMVSEDKDEISLRQEEVGEEDFMPTKNVLVPITIILCISGAYVILGSVIYVHWEGWNLLDASYFSFITLATIGLGDFVPGQSESVGRSFSYPSLVGKLVFTSLYCLLGLALLAMGIDLVQCHMVVKAKWAKSGLGQGKPGMDRYILTKHENVWETPEDKTGNKIIYGKMEEEEEEDSDDEVTEDNSISEEEA